MSISIAASDVVLLILAFFKENGLTESLKALENETGVFYNAPQVPSSQLVSLLLQGDWENLLPLLSGLELDASFLIDLFEHIALELALGGDYASSKVLIERSFALENRLKNTDPERYRRLQRTIESLESGDSFSYNISERRQQLSRRLLEEEITEIPCGQLLGLIGQALKYQYLQGWISPGIELDLFRSTASTPGAQSSSRLTKKSAETYWDCIQRIEMESGTNIPCAIFSKNGDCFVTASGDGFIEIWDYLSGKLRLDFSYQVTEEFMMHEASISCLDFSENGQMLASGSVDGQVIVWNFGRGKILRRFTLPCPPCCLCFHQGAQLLVGCSDGVIRWLGLKSGRVLKEYVGHTSFVNHILLYWDEESGETNEDVKKKNRTEMMASASSDGTIRIWQGQRSVQVIDGHRGGWNPTWSIQMLVPVFHDNRWWLIVFCASNRIVVWNRLEESVGDISPELDSCVVSAVTSVHFIHVVTENGYLYSVRWKSPSQDSTSRLESKKSGDWENMTKTKLEMSNVVGMTMHPNASLFAIWNRQGKIYFYSIS